MTKISPRLDLASIAAFFLRIGATGFGGPVAITNKMHRELVDEKKILKPTDFREAITLAHLMPGPLAIQVALYIGWRLGGIAGGTVAGICFILPSFIITVAIAWGYVAYSGIPQIQAAFHGVSASVAALILFNSGQLSRGILGRDRLLWGLAAAAAVITVLQSHEPFLMFLAAGAIYAVLKGPMQKRPRIATLLLILGATGFLSLTASSSSAADPAIGSGASLLDLFFFFFKSGALIFGSGLVIIPFMREPLIHDFGWLNAQQFIDAVAVGFMTPGPALITVAFIGYLVHGMAGAFVSSIGIFSPSWFFTLGAAPFYQRIIRHKTVEHAVAGISAAAVGAIAGAGVIIARDALSDTLTWAIALASMFVLVRLRRIPEGILIGLAACAGILADAVSRGRVF